MSASQRRKGAAAEREALKLLGEELGMALTRNLEQTRNGGGDCLVIRGWCVEVKRQERLSRPAWWRQAVEQAERVGARPMLLYRRSREAWTAWVHTSGQQWRQTDVIGAAQAIRESWLSD